MSKPELDIIKSPEGQRMLQMVTEGFYNRSFIGLWLFEVIGREYDDMAKWSKELIYEAFPQTCTWSITIWEFMYGFEPDDTLSLEYRRQRILAKKLQRPPVNPASIEAVVTALTGCPASITEDISQYKFIIKIENPNGIVYDGKEMLRAVKQQKPSHLTVILEQESAETILIEEHIYMMQIGRLTKLSTNWRLGNTPFTSQGTEVQIK